MGVPRSADGLTPKQARFVDEYLIDLNATQAAVRAGYSAKGAAVEGSRLLTNAKVSAAVASRQAERAAKTDMNEAWVLDRLRENVERSMVATPVMTFDHDKKGMVETGEYVYEGAVANKALELIGKHRGMFVERRELTGKNGGPLVVTVRFAHEGRRVTAS